MKIIHSSDLGWTAGQDISKEFAALAKTLKSGDTFVFDHMYKTTATNIQIADGVTLAGGAKGAGVDVLGTAAHINPFISIGDNSVLVDLTFTHSDVSTKNSQSNHGATIHAFGDNIQILNSHFEGGPAEFVRSGGDGHVIRDTVFDGAYYQMRWFGDSTNFVVENSLFQNSEGDGIKTARDGSGFGTANATISNSVFINNKRDGIDATGGFKDSLVTDSYFVDNGVSALDLKVIFDGNSNGGQDLAVGNVTVTNSELIGDRKVLIVTTLLNRNGTPDSVADLYAPHDITVSNSIFENTSSEFGQKSWLLKDGYDITSQNNQYLGDFNIRNDTGNPNVLQQIGDTVGEARKELPDSYYKSLAGPDWSNLSYPTDGTPTPIDPVVDPDPISFSPPDKVDPVIKASVQSNVAPVAKNDVANTDHDKTILVDVLGNDNDPDSGALRLTNVSYSGNTSIVSIENGKIKINPLSTATEDRVETITYTVSDGKGGTDTAKLKVNISGSVEVFASQVKASASQPDAEVPAEPAPVAPAPETSAPVTSISNLLDVFVAYTDTDETIFQFGATSSIDSSVTEGRSLTIYATPSGNGPGIGSVMLSIDGVGSRMENAEPYALFGDTNGDFLGGKELPEGVYAAELIVFSGKNGQGKVLETVTFDFAVDDAASEPSVTPSAPVVDAPAVLDPKPVEVIAAETDLAPDSTFQGPYSKFLDIKIVDTSTDEVVMDLHEGAKLSSSDFSDRKITLSAEAINSDTANIGSVKLELNGQYVRVENVEPYALFGDINGDFNAGKPLEDGTHFATLTVYSGKDGKGSVLEQVTVSFEVGDYESILIDGSLSTVSSYSESQDTGYAMVSEDQSGIELEGSAWKSLNLFEGITKDTVLTFDFKSDAEGEIQGIGFVSKNDALETMFFQLDGSQELGIQEFNDAYETGSGFKSYTIPVGEYFTGPVEQLVLVSDDDADLGAMSAFSNISLIGGIA